MPSKKTWVPLRPKRPAGEDIPEPLRTPASLPHSPANSALESLYSPTATAPEPTDAQATVPNDTSLPTPNAWPSQVAQSSSTMWLLPPYSDQASAIALLLRTEIESHNITREMLHATERRRLEAVQRCSQLHSDTHSWATAYNNVTAALYKCSEEYSRLSAENVALRTQMNSPTSTFQLDITAPKDKQIQLLRKKLSRRLSEGDGQAEQYLSIDTAGTPNVRLAENELEDTPCPYSPE